MTFPLRCKKLRCYEDNCYANVTSYPVRVDTTTASGLRVATNGNYVDLERLDRETNRLEQCLHRLGFEENLKRRCLIVLFPPDWYISECSGQQLFPCEINEEICREKMRMEGMEEDDIDNILDICPCNCRATIQDDNVIVTTPNLLLYRAELARMMTGENNPWTTPFVECLHAEE